MDELLEQFVIEGRELVQQASDDLLALEAAPDDATRIDGAFRAIHTLKGSAGLFGFDPMSVMLHAAEDVMGALRDRRLAAGATTIDPLLSSIGATETWVEAVASTGRLPPDAAATSQKLVAGLTALLGGVAAPAAGPAPQRDEGWLAGLLARHSSAAPSGTVLTGIRYTPRRDCFFHGDDPLALLRTVPGLVALSMENPSGWSLEDFDPFACMLTIEALSTAPAETIRPIFRFVADQAEIAQLFVEQPATAEHTFPELAPLGSRRTPNGAAAARTLRVDAARLDALADIAGELIVANNRLSHLVAATATAAPALGRALADNQAEIDRLVGDMHRGIARARMVPIGQTTRRLTRLVRDMANKLGKPILFDVSGADTEADKTIVDALFEPLLHLLRNAVDHGIEAAERRAAAGKPGTGRIGLHASRADNHIVVTVTDDGAGIEPARLREAAKLRGVMESERIDTLDDAASLELIFAPGFSTVSSVTDLSGRGVGLDAVRAALDSLGGRISVSSSVGSGTIVRMAVPQAVAVTTVMLVGSAGEEFGVPLAAVAETARIPVDRIAPIRDGEAFVLKGRTLALLRLSDLLGRPGVPRASGHARILVVGTDAQLVGVEVDRFGERLDVVLRPLDGLLAGTRGMLGAALTGDGRVMLVLDLPELVG